MKSKSRVAVMAGTMMVIAMMPVMPNYIAAGTTHEAYAAAQTYNEERTASYEEKAVDIVAYAQGKQETLKEESIFKGKAVATDTDYLAVMQEPDDDSEVAGKLFEYNIADVIEQDNGWTKITSGNLTGYVPTDALCFDDEAESVARLETEVSAAPVGSEAVVYASYDSDAAVTGTFTADESAVPVSRIGEYVKILKSDESTGYVLADAVTIDYGFECGMTVEEEEARKATEEAARQAAEEAARKAAEEEAARKAAEEALRQQIIARTIAGTDFTYNPTMAVSDDDLWVLACIIDWEAGWEPYEGKLAVANVILNRVRSERYPDTVSDVVYARGQFGGVMSGGSISARFEQRLAAGPRTDECMEAALEALSGKNNIGDFTAFNGSDVINYAALSDYAIIGGHCFY